MYVYECMYVCMYVCIISINQPVWKVRYHYVYHLCAYIKSHWNDIFLWTLRKTLKLYPIPRCNFLAIILLVLKYIALFCVVYGLLLLFSDLLLLKVIKIVRHRFGGLYEMKDFLSIGETPLALKISFKTATNLKCVLPTVIEIEIVLFMGTLLQLEIFIF